MKILHTSDWHIGKNIYGNILDNEFDLFIRWLVQTIDANNIDVLLIAGDIFDVAFPSSYAQQLYYQALAKLTKTRLKKILIIGGNHDSAAYLKAPQNILKALDIEVFAGLPDSKKNFIYPFPQEDPQVIFVTVPYLRQVDLLKLYPEAKNIQGMQASLSTLYNELFEMTKDYGEQGLPVIATGHLYVVDGDFDQIDKENYTLGGLVDIPSKAFPAYDYIALGHVHRPYAFPSQNIYYSGNPFLMGFNDIRRPHLKRVLIFDTGTKQAQSLEIPRFRDFVRFSGDLEGIKEKIAAYQTQATLKPAFAQVIVENSPDVPAQTIIEDLRKIENPDIKIIDFKIPPKNLNSKINRQNLRSLSELSELEIFKTFLEQQDLPQDKKNLLLQTYSELLDEIL